MGAWHRNFNLWQSNTKTSSIIVCLILSFMSPLQVECTSNTQWGSARAFRSSPVTMLSEIKHYVTVRCSYSCGLWDHCHEFCMWVAQPKHLIMADGFILWFLDWLLHPKVEGFSHKGFRSSAVQLCLTLGQDSTHATFR